MKRQVNQREGECGKHLWETAGVWGREWGGDTVLTQSPIRGRGPVAEAACSSWLLLALPFIG